MHRIAQRQKGTRAPASNISGAPRSRATWRRTAARSAPDPKEVALLARLAWEKEGGPPGLEARYHAEVEAQLRATRDLLASEYAAGFTPPLSPVS